MKQLKDKVLKRTFGYDMFDTRAPAADVLNVPNVKFLAHLAHQTQK